jgi:hypothetical protein
MIENAIVYSSSCDIEIKILFIISESMYTTGAPVSVLNISIWLKSSFLSDALMIASFEAHLPDAKINFSFSEVIIFINLTSFADKNLIALAEVILVFFVISIPIFIIKLYLGCIIYLCI